MSDCLMWSFPVQDDHPMCTWQVQVGLQTGWKSENDWLHSLLDKMDSEIRWIDTPKRNKEVNISKGNHHQEARMLMNIKY